MRGNHALQKAFYKTGGYLKRKTPTILTCAGAAGVVDTAVLTGKATVKAVDILKEAADEKGEELTNVEVVKAVAPVYVPAVLCGVATITCIFGANVINKHHQASLISAYGILEQSYKEYKNKVEELYGPRRR